MKEPLAKTLVVAAEIMGTELSVPAAEGMARELAAYPPPAVVAALKRCQRELRGRLTLADILHRIEDGWPEPEAAWALCQPARDEANTVIWTDEIAGAFGVATELLAGGDRVAARMAFLENYREALARARAAKRPPRWWPSLGHDKQGRATAVLDAVEHGRLAAEHARTLIAGDELAERRLRALQGLAPERAALPADAERLAALVKPKKL